MRKVYIAALLSVMSLAMSAQVRHIEVHGNTGDVTRHDVPGVESIKFIQVMNPVENIAVELSGRKSTITWDELPGASGYEVYHSTDGNEFTLLGTTDTPVFEHDYLPKGNNYYGVRATGGYEPGDMTVTPQPVFIPGETVGSGVYFGFVSYSNKVSGKDMEVLNSASASSFSTAINNLTMGPSTALYLGLDRGLDQLAGADLPDDLIDVSVITFTDGLENWSLNLDDRYDTPDDFLAALRERILDRKYSGMKLNSYTVGLRGTNVSTPQEILLFKETLKNLASCDEYAFEADDMSDVNRIFQDIASKLVATSVSQQVSVVIPGQPDATKVRFTFDNVSDASQSDCYIEGIYSHRHHSLDNVTSHGLSMKEHGVVDGTVVNDIFVRYEFSEMRPDDGGSIDMSAIQQWAMTGDSQLWQINSEFTPDDDMQTDVDKKSAAIVLVLDCSESLGDDFGELKRDAISFINTLIR